MKILVTGINGAVGGNLFRLFEKNKTFNLSGISRQPYNFLELNSSANTFSIDLVKNSLENSFFDKYDVIFHAAAITPKFAKSKADYSQNASIAQSLTKSLTGYKGRLFFFSTGSVYKPSEKMLNENSEMNFDDSYGFSMLKAEEIFIKSIKKLTIFRLFYPYGFDQHTSADNLIAKLYARIKSGKDISVNSNFNSILINPLYVSDLYYILCKFLNDELSTGIYNVVGPSSLTFAELIRILYDTANVSFKDLLIDETLSSPICGNGEKLFKHIDISKLTSINKGIKQINV